MKLIKFFIEIPKNIAKLLIKFYQKFLSFDNSFWGKKLGYKVCIHQPTCSQYTYEAIDKFGLIRGVIMGTARVIRCNPFAHGGFDPVPDKFSVKRNTKKNDM